MSNRSPASFIMRITRLNQHEERALLAHLKTLGLGDSYQSYQSWCQTNGFPKTLVKTSLQRRKEVEHHARQRVMSKYEENKKTHKSDFLGSLLNRQIEIKSKREGENVVVDDSKFPAKYKPLARCFWSQTSPTVDNICRLGLILKDKSDFLTFMLDKDTAVLGTLAKIADFEDHWMRSIESWEPKSYNHKRQFSSLLRHLFVKYEMPHFMDSVWWAKSHAQNQLQWYVHLGRGENLRKAPDLPIMVTKKIAHHFMQAPEDYNCMQALRWGQVFSMGGNARLMNALLNTKLDEDGTKLFINDEFWLSVVQWFIDNPMVDVAQIGPIIDYIHNQKFFRQDVIRNGIRIKDPPAQPNFTMKGRSPETLYKAVEKWHNVLSKSKRGGGFSNWMPSGEAWVREEGQGHSYRRWEIHELLDNVALQAEGKEMRHCVSSYAYSCISGRTRIWSLRCLTEDGVVDRLTIEVNQMDKQIVQARGKLNVTANDKQKRILNVWAVKMGYSFGRYVMGFN